MKIMKKKQLWVIIFVGVMLLFGWAYTKHFIINNSDNNRLPKVSLRLKWVFDPGFAGEMVASKLGFFRENGLDVTLQQGGFEADPIKLVASGSDTFGVTGADNFLLAREKGVPIIAFAAGYLETPVVYYVREDSSIFSPQDFIGKKVGYQAGQDTATVYEDMLNTLNIKRDSINEVPVQYDLGVFLNGQVDVWPGYAAAQSYTLKTQNFPYRTLVPKNFGVSHMGTVYFTSEDTLTNHPEWVRSFTKALISGWKYTYNHSQDSIPLIASYDTKILTPDYVAFALEKQKNSVEPEGRKFGVFTKADWQSLYDSLLKQGTLKTHFDLSTAFTEKFLDNQ
jgi:ABC-type nitrate/sulfonate/bicarbonate transport system substrate-binding protein